MKTNNKIRSLFNSKFYIFSIKNDNPTYISYNINIKQIEIEQRNYEFNTSHKIINGEIWEEKPITRN